MAAVISFLIILFISISIVKIASIMLKHTGMSEDMARFQARSAFTGTGFTTGESEAIVRHPVRRRIIMNLMFMGNVGIVSFVSTLILTFTSFTDQRDITVKLSIIAASLGFILLISRTGLIDWILSRLVQVFLKRFTRVYAHDYDSLLFLGKDYEVIKFSIAGGSWLADRSLSQSRLNDEGLLVLGIQRTDGYYVAVPRGETMVFSGDEIIVYGREQQLRSLMNRPAGEDGNREHLAMVRNQKRLEGRPDAADHPAGQAPDRTGLLGRLFRRKRDKRPD
jgi:hypothetical protein